MPRLLRSLARRTLPIGVAIVATAGITAGVMSGDEPTEFEKDVLRLDAEVAAKLQKWGELAQPGPEHERLVSLAGTWHVRTRYWPHPEAEGVLSTSIVTSEPILGGRFLLEHHAPDPAPPDDAVSPPEYTGLTIRGYDNQKRAHTLVWLDSMGTHMLIGESVPGDDPDTITYMARYTDPLDLEVKRLKLVHERRDDDTYAITLYEDLGRNAWFRHVESVATRR